MPGLVKIPVEDPHLVAPAFQRLEDGGVHRAARELTSPDGHVATVPPLAGAADLDLRPGEGRRRVHHCGADVTSDVEDDRSWSARVRETFHGYGATDTGVFDGFEKPL